MFQSKFLNLALKYLCLKPEKDLFVTNIVNTQFGEYVEFRLVAKTMNKDAFSIDWYYLNFYAFPPICF